MQDLTSAVSMSNISSGVSMLKKSMDFQSSMVNKLIDGSAMQMNQDAMIKDTALQQMGIGQNLNKVC